MSVLEESQAILGRLEEVLADEGLVLEATGVEGRILLVRGRRTGPGAPTAFLVRAVEGTFRRYLPQIQGVRLVEYQGVEGEPSAAPPPRPASALPPSHGAPGLQLSGLDRRDAARALEAFLEMEQRRGTHRARVMGLDEDAPRRAAEKVLAHSGVSHHPQGERPDTWVLHLSGACQDEACSAGADWDEPIPGRILLVAPPA